MFWRLSPRQFQALCERRDVQQRRADARAALIAAVIANVYRDKKRPPFEIEDFLLAPKRPQPATGPQLAEDDLRALAMQLQQHNV